MTSNLAILGGNPIRSKPWNFNPVISSTDIDAVVNALKKGKLSGFRAGNYDGGDYVKSLEAKISELFGIRFSVAFDTWSNGLIGCLLAMGIAPGDEVILPAYTMSACAASVLSIGAVPVFAEIKRDSFCIDPDDIERKISSKTRAIMVVHLFGYSADMDKIVTIARNKNILVMEDCAQAPLSRYNGRICGTIGDVGGISLTESKHVTCGEGGVAFTNDEKINNGLRYVRNHGEVTSFFSNGYNYSQNVISHRNIGFNFRMTELSASLACSQLENLINEIKIRQTFAEYLNCQLKDIEFLDFVGLPYKCDNSVFLYPLRYKNIYGVSKSRICAALNAEGIPFMDGYCKPIYRQKIYHEYKHSSILNFHVNYDSESFPVTERIHNEELLTTMVVRSTHTIEDMQDIINAFYKIRENIKRLS